jgi:hypothetical protein
MPCSMSLRQRLQVILLCRCCCQCAAQPPPCGIQYYDLLLLAAAVAPLLLVTVHCCWTGARLHSHPQPAQPSKRHPASAVAFVLRRAATCWLHLASAVLICSADARSSASPSSCEHLCRVLLRGCSYALCAAATCGWLGCCYLRPACYCCGCSPNASIPRAAPPQQRSHLADKGGEHLVGDGLGIAGGGQTTQAEGLCRQQNGRGWVRLCAGAGAVVRAAVAVAGAAGYTRSDVDYVAAVTKAPASGCAVKSTAQLLPRLLMQKAAAHASQN